ncbi:MAG TPA: nucleotidyltransferase domain-containing protein [Candidatus Bathyarchaeia archaeon]|nr:nucleotidyltransferase domain-containing protein [Candidatus Bathyarchaeia archaeon]
MLKLFNDLHPFFEDNYRRINVREYARILNISPPTSSKMLKSYHIQGLLLLEEDKNYLNFVANNENELFIYLSRIYWFQKFSAVGLLDYLREILLSPLVILFGSFTKAEVRKESDVDLAIFSPLPDEVLLNDFERKLQREIQLFKYETREKVPSQELLNNILNGFILMGGW